MTVFAKDDLILGNKILGGGLQFPRMDAKGSERRGNSCTVTLPTIDLTSNYLSHSIQTGQTPATSIVLGSLAARIGSCGDK